MCSSYLGAQAQDLRFGWWPVDSQFRGATCSVTTSLALLMFMLPALRCREGCNLSGTGSSHLQLFSGRIGRLSLRCRCPFRVFDFWAVCVWCMLTQIVFFLFVLLRFA